VSMTQAPDRFTAPPGEQELSQTVVALEEHGFSVEVVDTLEAARETVLARIPAGSTVMTNTSMTLEAAGITPDQIDAALDPAHYLGAAAEFTDAALAAHESLAAHERT